MMTFEFKHDLGTSELPEDITSAVALEFSFVDALVALDIDVKGIADDGDSTNLTSPLREAVGDYVSVGTRLDPDFESIRSSAPQLIIGDSNRHKEIYEELSEIAPTILFKSFDAGYQETLEVFQRIGTAVSKSKDAKERLDRHQALVNDFNNQISIDKNKETLAAVVSEQGVTAHSNSTYVGEFLTKLGFATALNDKVADTLPAYRESDYLEMSYEQLANVNPERLIVMVEDDNDKDLNKLQNSNQWDDLEAVKSQRVHFVSRDDWAKLRGLIASEDIVETLANLNEA
ncbi:iron citrate ABC transporter substrate-binding protein [Staphylococcus saprophyticus]|nr:ABC transporter substrate-binding protein [Staphylococcus saprophyticus]MBN6095884.1 ABC transporter substrate-binding protein [Staphylococcus saprophyticus]MBN6099308.1 ABC transporter substrate-binding protein [Staphylococcus saprophyticus]RXS21740.1 iron citrate ABC transporter substrate-binding protein [Staphylococcus saprophyticus]